MDPKAPGISKASQDEGKSPLHWLISVLVVILVIGAASAYYLVAKKASSNNTTQATPTPGVTEAQALSTDTVISDLSTQVNKELSSIAEDQNSNEDTVPTTL